MVEVICAVSHTRDGFPAGGRVGEVRLCGGEDRRSSAGGSLLFPILGTYWVEGDFKSGQEPHKTTTASTESRTRSTHHSSSLRGSTRWRVVSDATWFGRVLPTWQEYCPGPQGKKRGKSQI